MTLFSLSTPTYANTKLSVEVSDKLANVFSSIFGYFKSDGTTLYSVAAAYGDYIYDHCILGNDGYVFYVDSDDNQYDLGVSVGSDGSIHKTGSFSGNHHGRLYSDFVKTQSDTEQYGYLILYPSNCSIPYCYSADTINLYYYYNYYRISLLDSPSSNIFLRVNYLDPTDTGYIYIYTSYLSNPSYPVDLDYIYYKSNYQNYGYSSMGSKPTSQIQFYGYNSWSQVRFYSFDVSTDSGKNNIPVIYYSDGVLYGLNIYLDRPYYFVFDTVKFTNYYNPSISNSYYIYNVVDNSSVVNETNIESLNWGDYYNNLVETTNTYITNNYSDGITYNELQTVINQCTQSSNEYLQDIIDIGEDISDATNQILEYVKLLQENQLKEETFNESLDQVYSYLNAIIDAIGDSLYDDSNLIEILGSIDKKLSNLDSDTDLSDVLDYLKDISENQKDYSDILQAIKDKIQDPKDYTDILEDILAAVEDIKTHNYNTKLDMIIALLGIDTAIDGANAVLNGLSLLATHVYGSFAFAFGCISLLPSLFLGLYGFLPTWALSLCSALLVIIVIFAIYKGFKR